jgi:hypothetical protein
LTSAAGGLPDAGVNGRVVDADGHVLEPMSAWAGVPDRYRPRVSRDDLDLLIGGQHTAVADFFTIQDGKIRRLVIYLTGSPPSPDRAQFPKPTQRY